MTRCGYNIHKMIGWGGTAVLCGVVLASGAIGRPSPAGGAWTDRLEALEPGNPIEYFELAEEVADAAAGPADSDLARQLFALAGVLDPSALGRSACLALADMEENELNRRRLLALAPLLGGGGIGQGPSLNPASPMAGMEEASTLLAVTEALSHYRRGRGNKALDSLDEPGAMELLTNCGHLLHGGTDRFLEDCRLYKGQLRPSLSEEDILRMLRLEIALLGGDDRPWSSELLISRARPLIEVDPNQLEEALGVDASLPIYRAGVWVAADR